MGPVVLSRTLSTVSTTRSAACPGQLPLSTSVGDVWPPCVGRGPAAAVTGRLGGEGSEPGVVMGGMVVVACARPPRRRRAQDCGPGVRRPLGVAADRASEELVDH